MIRTAYASQLPRLSKFDPGAAGEGSLDPMGVAALADRIADLLAPGLRARMSHPRFVTLSALGGFAGMRLNGAVARDGTTTPDIAYEWMVVEGLVRNSARDSLVGLPGTQKARRAWSVDERLNTSNYLRGPRVFGFTGVYRPFSVDAGILEKDGQPGLRAQELVLAWEADNKMTGFLAETPGTDGAQLRRELARFLADSLRKGECAFPPTGWAAQVIAATMLPSGAGRRERTRLRALVTNEEHEVRHVLTTMMAKDPLPGGVGEHEIANGLLRTARGRLRDLLSAATAYERCATLLTNTFRRMLRHGVAHTNGLVPRGDRTLLPFADSAAAILPELVTKAVLAAARVDEFLASEVESGFELFSARQTVKSFVDAVVARHATVQADKGKRAWLDELPSGWYVRPPFRDQQVPGDDEWWIHPMRLRTISRFLEATR